MIAGHYGSGKTNLAVNLALHLRMQQRSCAIADIDIVNPYFRTADSEEELREAGIRCVLPMYANTNLDIPALPPEIYSFFGDRETCVLLDAGGDETGAAALGMYAPYIAADGYEMLYVVNRYRPLTHTPEEAASVMREIEAASHLRCTAIVNNSNLGAETVPETILDSLDYGKQLSELTGLPQRFISGCLDMPALPGGLSYFKMKNITKNLYGGTINEPCDL